MDVIFGDRMTFACQIAEDNEYHQLANKCSFDVSYEAETKSSIGAGCARAFCLFIAMFETWLSGLSGGLLAGATYCFGNIFSFQIL